MKESKIEASDIPILRSDEPTLPGVTVRDFWAWALGDLPLNASRGVLVQFLVAKAVGDTRLRDDGWGDFDVSTPRGHQDRGEVLGLPAELATGPAVEDRFLRAHGAPLVGGDGLWSHTGGPRRRLRVRGPHLPGPQWVRSARSHRVAVLRPPGHDHPSSRPEVALLGESTVACIRACRMDWASGGSQYGVSRMTGRPRSCTPAPGPAHPMSSGTGSTGGRTAKSLVTPARADR